MPLGRYGSRSARLLLAIAALLATAAFNPPAAWAQRPSKAQKSPPPPARPPSPPPANPAPSQPPSPPPSPPGEGGGGGTVVCDSTSDTGKAPAAEFPDNECLRGSHVCDITAAIDACGRKNSAPVVMCCCHSDLCPEICCEEPMNELGELEAAKTDKALALAIDRRIKACNSRGSGADQEEPDYVAKCGVTQADGSIICPTGGSTTDQPAERMCSWCDGPKPPVFYTAEECGDSSSQCCPTADAACCSTGNAACCGYNPKCTSATSNSCYDDGHCYGCNDPKYCYAPLAQTYPYPCPS